MKYNIAGFITEYTAKYENLRRLSEPFLYTGERKADICLRISEKSIEEIYRHMIDTDIGETENYVYSTSFNRKIIPHGAMLIHSSGIILDGKAYLFSADSGVGKSTHTRLWLREFGDRVHIFNDDKPVVKLSDGKVTAHGTPFDGASGIALNESAPLAAIVFVERGKTNSVRVPDVNEITRRLYFQTAHMVNAVSANAMLENFDKLVSSGVRFYVLSCNMNPEAAHVAYDAVVLGKY